MVEKIVNVKVKTSLQQISKIKKINFRYAKDYKLTKKDKDKAN